MRPVVRAAFLALASALVIAYLARHAPAQEIHFPSNLSIEGQVVCAGPPQNGDPLMFNNGQWCNAIPNTVCLNMLDNTGVRTCAMQVGGNNQLFLFSKSNQVVIDNPGVLETSTGGVGWQGFGGAPDTTETLQQRATTTFYFSGALSGSPFWGTYETSKPLHVRSISLGIQTAGAGCTTAPIVTLQKSAVSVPGSNITLTNGVPFFVLGALNLAFAAGDDMRAAVTTAGVGCTTFPTNLNYIVEWTTD